MINTRLDTIFLPLVLVIALLIPAGAAAADWKIVRMSGDVRVYHNNVTWISLKQDYRLKPGEAVWTGRNGRVMLASASGRILLKPRSMVRIPVRSSRGSYTVLHQYSGTVEADIDSRKIRHFSVKTPFLAAVVKGTKFTMSIKAGASELRVQEGIVEATDPKSGQRLDVLAGQFVGTRPGKKGGLFGTAKGAKSAKAAGRSGAQNGVTTSSSSAGSSGAGSAGEETASAGRSSGGGTDSASDQRSMESGWNRGRGRGWTNRSGWGRGRGPGWNRGRGPGWDRGRGPGGDRGRGRGRRRGP